MQKALLEAKVHGLRFEDGKFSFRSDGTDLERYGMLLNLLPTDVDNPHDIWISCAVPHCVYKVKVYTPTSSLNLGNWVKHSQTNHPILLADTDQKSTESGQILPASKRLRQDNPAVTKEQELAQVKLVVTAGLPLSFVEHPAFRQFLAYHEIPTTMSRRKATRITLDLEETDVVAPRSEILTRVFQKVTLTHGNMWVDVIGKISASSDGWTSRCGQSLESIALTVPEVTKPVFGTASQLRPRPILIGLKHLIAGKYDKEYAKDDDEGLPAGVYYSADVRARQFSEWLSEITHTEGKKLTSANLLHINSDSTNVQPAFIELIHPRVGGIARLDHDKNAPPMSGCFYMECNQHISSLCAADLIKDNIFKTVHVATDKLSLFLRGSDKRIEALLDAEQSLGWKTMKKPVSFPVTRFTYAILQMKRLLELLEPMQRMMDNNAFGTDHTSASTFTTLFSQFKAHKDKTESILLLLEPQLKHSAAMGASSTYTNSLHQVYFWKLRNHAEALLKTPEGIRIDSTINTYLSSIYERLASVSTITKARDASMLPDLCDLRDNKLFEKFKSSKKYPRKVYRDDIVNAAAYLDPAVYPSYGIFGHNRKDSLTFMVRLVKGSIVRHDDAIQLVMTSEDDEEEDTSTQQKKKQKALRKEYEAKKKSIEEEKNTNWMMADEEITLQRENKLTTLKSEYRLKGLDLPTETSPSRKSAPQVTQAQIQTMIEEQMKTYEDLLVTLGNVFGDPFEEHKNRYEFWPKHGPKFPALYFCARILLGTTLSAMENERFHSTAAYINNKLRSSLTAASISRLVLLKKFLSEALEAAKVKMGNDLDVIDAIDDFFDPEPTATV